MWAKVNTARATPWDDHIDAQAGTYLTLKSEFLAVHETVRNLATLEPKALWELLTKATAELVRKEDKKIIALLLGFLRRHGKKIPIEEFDETGGDFYRLTTYSKKKVVAVMMREKFPDPVERKRVFNMALNLAYYPEIPELASDVWMLELYQWIGDAYADKIVHGLPELKDQFENMAYEDQIHLIALLKLSGVETMVIQALWSMAENDKDAIVRNSERYFPDGEITWKLLPSKDVNRKGISDFNPLLFWLDTESGIKIFWEARFREIYLTTFTEIAQELYTKEDGITPTLNNFFKINTSRLKPISERGDKEKDEYAFQHILEWDIDESFTEEDLKTIAQMMREEVNWINLQKPDIPEAFLHPISTLEGKCKYSGYFDESGNRFLANSLMTLKQEKKTWAKMKLRLTLDDYNQDNFVYLMAQISHYLKHKKFFKKSQLYFNIFDQYNQKFLGNGKMYDMSIFSQQHAQMMEKMVIPHSIEVLDQGMPASNMLLTGPYGVGKSEFLKCLLLSKVFPYRWKDFHLNANVIPVDLQTFKGALINGIGWFRSRLHEIYEKTKLPIILVIEDIDTLVNEELHKINDEVAQAMTLFFAGVGSVPVKVIATANDPYKLSKRLIRPGRIYEIVPFYTPGEDEKMPILERHMKDFGIEISQEVKTKLPKTKLFQYGTASHYMEFGVILATKKKIKWLFGEEEVLSDSEILEVATTISISVEDLQQVIKFTQKWIEEVTWGHTGPAIWYTRER